MRVFHLLRAFRAKLSSKVVKLYNWLIFVRAVSRSTLISNMNFELAWIVPHSTPHNVLPGDAKSLGSGMPTFRNLEMI